jgi:hypothetical protein
MCQPHGNLLSEDNVFKQARAAGLNLVVALYA